MVSATTRPPTPPGAPAAETIYAQSSRENFPVASRVLPRAVRDDLMAVYGFARLTDDIGDEAEGDRTATLIWLESELELSAAGAATHPVVRRLGRTIRNRSLSLQPFRDLVAANLQDQTVHRYERFGDLEQYCRLSANPVGRVVLAILESDTAERVALSDSVCTGLQVVEHLQDVAEDLRQDRIYLPLEDLRREGCTEDDLRAASAGPALRRVVALEAARARRLLFSAAPLAASLPWRARLAVAGFGAGGMAALDAIERADYDVLANRCRPRLGRFAARLALLLAAPGAAARGAVIAAGGCQP